MKCYLSTTLSLLGSRLCASDKLHSSTSYLFLSDQPLEVNSVLLGELIQCLATIKCFTSVQYVIFFLSGNEDKYIPISSFVQKFNTCS